MLIAEQIERAAADAGPSSSGSSSSTPPPAEGLKRDEGAEKVVLSLSMKPPASAPSLAPLSSSGTAAESGLKLNPLKPVVNPLKANPLKRSNVFKMAGTSASGSSGDAEKGNEKKRAASTMTAAERLILEEQDRKRRRMDRESVS